MNILDDYDLETIEGMENVRNFLEARVKRKLEYHRNFKLVFAKSKLAVIEEVRLEADKAARLYASAERALSVLRSLLNAGAVHSGS